LAAPATATTTSTDTTTLTPAGQPAASNINNAVPQYLPGAGPAALTPTPAQ